MACAECGAELGIVCPACGRENWSGVERCGACGRELDPLGHAFRTVDQSFRIQREELARRSADLRIREEGESRARLELFQEADRRRLRRAAEAAQRAKQRERRIIAAAGIAMAAFLILAVAAAWLAR
ncbi:MAG: hypothetical protein JW929_10685 [Anaerolineales bacterium]|nr:hypothetical protein [Anaerolineales bacterium]